MRLQITLFTLLLLMGQSLFAQMPKNDDKEFEYTGEADVRRAGAGDLVKRLGKWGTEYFADAMALHVAVDDSTERFVEIDVTEQLVEMHFGVNRTHKDRSIRYHLKFDTERKSYAYWINDFHYKALEIDHKNREENHDDLLSEIKSAATKSLEEEMHARMLGVIESFKEAAEAEIEE